MSDAIVPVELPTDRPVWDRLDNEPHRWHSRFERFRIMGPTRSLLMTYKTEWAEYHSQSGGKPRKKAGDSVPRSWDFASQRWRWRARAQAWDNFLALEDQKLWEERREAIRAMDWDMAQRLREKAEEILKLPAARIERKSTVIDKDGNVVPTLTIIEPAARLADAARMIQIASELTRLSAQMATANVAVSVDWRKQAREEGIEDVEALVTRIEDVITRELAASALSGSDGAGEGERRENGRDGRPVDAQP